MSRWSSYDLAQRLADNPDLRLSPENSPSVKYYVVTRLRQAAPSMVHREGCAVLKRATHAKEWSRNPLLEDRWHHFEAHYCLSPEERKCPDYVSRSESPSELGIHQTRQKGRKRPEQLVEAQSVPILPLSFTVLGSPVPKPRQTRKDKWAKRPCVLRYRAWADSARAECHKAKRDAFPDIRFDGEIRYGRIQAIAFFKMPSIWNSTTKAKMRDQPHCLRPDADNLLKAIADALYPTGDEHLYDLRITKRWEDENGPRTVITLY